MIPILYATVTEGTVPNHYGVGSLTDCLSCKVTEERNGTYELVMEYASDGIHAEDIAPNKFIKAKPNFTDNPQLFRIYKVGKTMNQRFTINAQHVSYDLSGKVIQSGSANSCVDACSLLQTKSGNFTINTDKTVSASFNISAPSSVRSWFGGKEGSLLDVYGGEWEYDNYTCSLKQARGQDRGVQIRYGKNLTELSQQLDMSNLVTSIIPYYIDTNGNKTIGSAVSTGLVLDVPREVAIDFSADVDPESATPISTQLTNLATRYKNNNNLTTITNSITLDFVQLKDLQERVDLCDTVHIFFEALGISATAKCIKTEWDVLEERYTKTTFGDAKTNIADTIAKTTMEVAEKPSRSFMDEAITHATELITGNLGGYVILHDADGDGKPDEILIMNTEDTSTATEVWRWNKNGLAYGTSYSGPFNTLALTSDGQIVASAITTGTFNADLIKAGTISDTQGNSTIDMTTGEAKMKNFKAKNTFSLIDSNNVVRAEILHNYGSGTSLNLKDNSANTVAAFFYDASTSNGGQIRLFNLNQKQTLNIWANNSSNEGCAIWINDKEGNNKIFAKGTPNGGIFQVYDVSGTASFTVEGDKGTLYAVFNKVTASQGTYGASVQVKNNSNQVHTNIFTGTSGQSEIYTGDGSSTNIYLHGGTGNITCVSLTQTSSREVKKNIEEMDDAEKILELRPVRFDFKNENLGTDRRGFIAEEVNEVLPNLVSKGDTMSLNYTEMIPYLVSMIQKQEARIKALEDKLYGNSKP